MPALLVARGGLGGALGGDAHVAQVGEEVEEHAQLVARRSDARADHQRRVEGRDVHVQDGRRHALVPDGGEPAAHGLARPRPRHRPARPQIFAEEQRVDLGRRAAQRGRLVVERHEARLREVGRRQDRGDGERLDGVVARIGHQPVGVVGELPRNPGGVDVRAIGGGHAEMARDVLEPERWQVARADVVQLREHPRVDDVAAGDLVAAEADRALGDL